MFAAVICFKNTLTFEKIHLVLLFVAVERGIASGGDLHEPHGISRAVVVCCKKEPCLHTGKTWFSHWYGRDIRCVFDEHNMK